MIVGTQTYQRAIEVQVLRLVQQSLDVWALIVAIPYLLSLFRNGSSKEISSLLHGLFQVT